MGKEKHKRQKIHIAAPKPFKVGKKNDFVEIVDMMDTDTSIKPPTLIREKLLQGEGLFKDVKIGKDILTQNLPDFDARSSITSKSLKGLQMKKKDKQKLKHELWVKKLNAVDAAKKEAKKRKQKQQTPVVGDIGALGDALPTLDLLLKGSKGSTRNSDIESRKKSVPKEKTRQKQMLEDISIFKQVLAHPAYKENPTATILEHLQNRQLQEDTIIT